MITAASLLILLLAAGTDAPAVRPRPPGLDATIPDRRPDRSRIFSLFPSHAKERTSARCAYRQGAHEHSPRSAAASPTQDPARAGLGWLARHQRADGAWGADAVPEGCDGETGFGGNLGLGKPGRTGLALLAFLAAGESHRSREVLHDPRRPDDPLRVAHVMKQGYRWLLRHQREDGGFVGPADDSGASGDALDHVLAACALVETYEATLSPLFVDSARRALAYLTDRVLPDSNDLDARVQGWAWLTLRSTRLLDPQRKSLLLAQIEERLGDPYSVNDMDAGVGLAIAFESGDFQSPRTLALRERLLRSLPDRDPAEGGGTPEFWFFSRLALDGLRPGDGHLPDAELAEWEETVIRTLEDRSRRSSGACSLGSWEPATGGMGAGDRTATTALHVLTLRARDSGPGSRSARRAR